MDNDKPQRRTIWDLAEEAARCVAQWPERKRRAADQALVRPNDGALRKTWDDVL